MSISLSSYLNIVRLVAAVLVYFYHAGHFSGIQLPVLTGLGQEAVVVFFVLSGFVIAYSTTAKPTTARSFALDRLARLWSVMLPALALTVVADEVGQALALSVYGALQPYSAFKWTASIAINTAFLSQIWSFNIWPGSNGPFWSISYEFWFYLIFATALFSKGNLRFILMTATLLVAGPKILGAFPIWFLGVALFMYLARHPCNPKTLAWPLWLLTWALAALAMWIDAATLLKAEFPGAAEQAPWGVNFWPISYSLGLLVTLNIYAFSGINEFGAFLSRHSKTIRTAADTSFGLYLFHYPLLHLTKAILVWSGVGGAALGIAVFLIPLLASVVLAHYCESFKPIFRIWLEHIFNKMSRRTPVSSRA